MTRKRHKGDSGIWNCSFFLDLDGVITEVYICMLNLIKPYI